jgi:hypothetical protein
VSAGVIEKLTMLREAGVRRVMLWMGPGGAPHELLVRSMKLFSEHVRPYLA